MKQFCFLLSYLFFFATSLLSFSQQYINPLNIPPALSGNFGELRGNHFHSGVDFKTQGVTGKPVLAVEDGYISRISVSPGGYGLALYVDHPATGHTSVYAHLKSFSKKIADWVIIKQYEQESFQVNLHPEKGMMPVKRGEQIALSGNTGSSGGPHLHLEIRDTHTQEPLDVLEYIGQVPDTQKPDLRGIAIYPVAGKGIVNGSGNPLRMNIGKDKAGNPSSPGKTVNAWGRIGTGVKAYDRMNGQSNIYGVKYIRLFVDDKQIFSSTIGRYSFNDTRMLNSFIDFEDWKNRRSFFMNSFIEPGNRLPFYESANRGYIDIDEERAYRFRYELEDLYGNMLSYSFTVNGQRQEIPEEPGCSNWMAWNLHNSFLDLGFSLSIPTGNLYDNFCYSHFITKKPTYYSDVHHVNNNPVPLHKSGTIWIKLHTDTLQNRNQYGIVKISDNGNESWIGGSYKRGGVEASIRELGDRYAVSSDTVAPVITPLEPAGWVSQKKIRIRLSDDKSGIAYFRGEINGKYVLFTHDSKSPVYTYIFDDSRLIKGEKQILVFRATDRAGNSSEYSYSFHY
ncbi:M23 family metallopeptidase [Proteiniphilum sp. UBA5310]|uniref:M23 family metallopeptidase n=1 Tax=Proteiniphilum sp. UBA5310 TaxID=1947275 RepID=UPI00257BEC80|nr:M23 family metallopeptidase [Proteiniphilum sp. UBA5310]